MVQDRIRPLVLEGFQAHGKLNFSFSRSSSGPFVLVGMKLGSTMARNDPLRNRLTSYENIASSGHVHVRQLMSLGQVDE